MNPSLYESFPNVHIAVVIHLDQSRLKVLWLPYLTQKLNSIDEIVCPTLENKNSWREKTLSRLF